MTFPLDPNADPLHEWLEARAKGRAVPTPPRSDPEVAGLLQTASEVDELATQYEEVALNTRIHRHRTWEELMTASSASDLTALGSTTTHKPRRENAPKAGALSWSSYASMGLVLALIVGLMSITYSRIDTPSSSSPPPNNGTLPTLLQGDSTPEEAAAACVARDVTWQEGEQQLSPNRPFRYVAVERAPDDIGQQALETYLGFIGCFYAIDPISPTDNPEERERAQATYLTSNGETLILTNQFLFLEETSPLGAEFSANAPIPLNRPPTLYLLPGATIPTEAFAPEDVYRFFDGRYGVVLGDASTANLRNEPDELSTGLVTFVAFIEQDRQLFIDEYVSIYLNGNDWETNIWSVESYDTPEASPTPEEG